MSTLSVVVLFGTFVGLFLGSRATTPISSSGCLCTSDQPCWPSAESFSQLESQLSQPLIYPRPSAYACYPPSHPSGNCTDVNANWGDGNWRSSHPGSMDLVNYETYMFPNGTLEACFQNTTITGMCGQGRVPVIGVDARSVKDIQAAVGFAVNHSLKVVVKNTGHDFIGRSVARGGFMVWTHNMKNITYDAAFVPKGAPGNETFEAVTLGAGVQWGEAYVAMNQHGRMMVGGISAGGSVGAAGGWLSGGGHSLLSPTYGLGVDNALEISIVLSTGEYLTTNSYQNSDLFWALRGGGPSTYGIVTSVTYRTYPIVPIRAWQGQANVTDSSVLPELLDGFLRFQIPFTDAGWGGYAGVSSQGVNFLYFGPNMTNETVTMTTQSWHNFTQALAPRGVMSSSNLFPLSWNEIVQQVAYSAGGVGGYVMITSRLLSRNTITNHLNNSEVTKLLLSRNATFNVIAGGKVSKFAADSAGLNPAWRDAVVEAIYGIDWEEYTPSRDVRARIQQFKENIQTMYDATPDDGTYLNEASPLEVNWQKSFFGAHYPTLKSIKDKYDPYRLFVVKEGVGSEDWNDDLTCRWGS